MSIVSVIGTRPQYIKYHAIWKAFQAFGLGHEYIDTGQHYSPELSRDLIEDLGIPLPLLNLNVGSGSHAVQTSKMLTGLEEVLSKLKPSGVLVYGDTNSTLAAALVAAKLNIPIGHIEAGLRSRNKKMPEEVNRIVVDHISDRLYAPTESSLRNLQLENLAPYSVFSGDIMIETLRHSLLKVTPYVQKYPYYLATIHRHSNVDTIERISEILLAFNRLDHQVILLAHPRIFEAVKLNPDKLGDNVHILPAQTHTQTLSMILGSQGVITDSGGLQKEAYLLGKICTTLRSEIEWIETLSGDWNRLCANISDLRNTVARKIPINPPAETFGNGEASRIIVNDFLNYINS